MSMFERLGEKVERFKQEAVSARDESADFRCRNCEAEIYSEQETCPDCDSSDIERLAEERSDDGGRDDDTAAETAEDTPDDETAADTPTDDTAEETPADETTADTPADDADDSSPDQ